MRSWAGLFLFLLVATVARSQSNVGGGSGGGGLAPNTPGIPFQNGNVFYALNYGMKWDAKFSYTASFSIGSPTVSCSASDIACVFTSADVGKIVFATTQASGLACPKSTILTVNSATNITISNNCTLNSGVSSMVAWGHDDTAAFQAAWNAFVNGGGGIFQMPCAGTFINKGIGTAVRTQLVFGPVVNGCGQFSTFIHPMPDFDTTTCLFDGQHVCMFFGVVPPITLKNQYSNFSWNGLYQQTANGLINPAVSTAVFSGYDAFGEIIDNVSVFEWMASANATNLIGWHAAQWTTAKELQIQQTGFVGMSVTGCCSTMTGSGVEGSELHVLSGGYMVDTGGYHISSTPGLLIDSGGVFVANGTTIGGGSGTTGAIVNNGTLYADHLMTQIPGGTAPAVQGGTLTSNGTTYLCNSDIENSWNVSAVAILLSGGTLYDTCQNKLVGTNGQITRTGGSLVSSPSFNSFTPCLLGGASGTASPAACAAAASGVIAIPASQTTYTVNSIAVNTGSVISVWQTDDNTGLPSSPTCNTGATNPVVTTRSASTSFTISLASVASVTCVGYSISH